MPHMSLKSLTVMIALFCLLTTASQAETAPSEESDKQKLRSLLQKLDQTGKQRQEHHSQVEALSQQLECNWALIRAYETCGQLHEKNPEEHLKCSGNAKQNAARCLEKPEDK